MTRDLEGKPAKVDVTTDIVDVATESALPRKRRGGELAIPESA